MPMLSESLSKPEEAEKMTDLIISKMLKENIFNPEVFKFN